MNPWEESWDTSKVKGAGTPLDAALAAEGIQGPLADIARSIYAQESSSGKNTKTSNRGAVGGMQILPATFQGVADRGWDINDPVMNARAGLRYLKQGYEASGGDPALTGAFYYGGPGGLTKAKQGVAVSDPLNPQAPNTLQYGQQVAARIPKQPMNPVMALGQAVTDAIIPSAQAAEAKMPWEEKWEAPAATQPAAKERGFGSKVAGAVLGAINPVYALKDVLTNGQSSVDTAGGLIRGAGSIGATIAAPYDMAMDAIKGDRQAGMSSLVTGQKPLSRNQERRRDMDNALRDMGVDTNSLDFQQGKLGAEIAGTAGVGNALAIPVRAARAPALANAIASGGMSAGGAPTQGVLQGAKNLLLRSAGGAITGGASAGLIDPESAGTGAAVGAALPSVVKGLGAAGSAVGRVIRGPEVPEGVRDAAAAAREAGYVIPPTQVKPTLTNRLLEGTAGKLTTAQNASAANQQVTNRLAKQAIGAEELSPEGLQAVRDKANQAYTALGQSGQFTADDAFREALKKAGAPSAQLQKDFPALANQELSSMVKSFSQTGEFDAQSAIEAIKVLRAAQRSSLGAPDPSVVAMGRAQGKIANALEDLVDRNLASSGNQELLGAYRDARRTLAKVYDVEKALNPASGNVDAKKVANLLKKGRLTDELKQIGEFAGSFPKAAQTLENMGSLPQTSPLDWTAAGGISAATGGSPVAALGLVARPTARTLALSPLVQNRLAAPPSLPLLTEGARRNLLQPLYRAGPVLASDR